MKLVTPFEWGYNIIVDAQDREPPEPEPELCGDPPVIHTGEPELGGWHGEPKGRGASLLHPERPE